MRSSNLENFPDTKKSLGEVSEKFIKIWGFDPTELQTSDEYARGFTQIPNRIYKYLPRLGIGGNQSGLAILLFYIISRDFDGKGNSFPGIRTIASEIDSSPGTVGRNLRKLKKLGLIEIRQRRTKRGQFTNVYTWKGFKKKMIGFMIEDGLIDNRK